MTETYTPGPWGISEHDGSIIGPDGQEICEVADYRNEALILAAPALVAALSALVDDVERINRPETLASWHAFHEARSVLAAIRGATHDV